MRWIRITPSALMRAVAALLVLASILPVPGCSAPAGSGDLSLFDTSPSSLDPAMCSDSSSASYIVNVFSGLVTLDRELEVIGDIAESWEVSADGRTYTFHLRDGVKFHSGRELTAADFKYSIERAADPQTGSSVAEAYLGDIVGFREKIRGEAEEVSGVQVVDNRTLEITIDAPKAYFLSKLTHPTSFVVNSANVASGDEWWRQPDGTGPFKLHYWAEGQIIVLHRNDDFYRGKARLNSVTYNLRGSPMMMYENGQIDIVAIGASDVDRALDTSNPLNRELVVASELSVYYIGFNVSTPPLDDVRVRQALCHAVDKEKLVEVLAKGIVTTAYGILPPGMPGYNDSLEGLRYDVTLARQLLNESSYSGGLPSIVLSTAGWCVGVSAISSAIAWMWQENLGANVSIQCVEPQTFYTELQQRELTAFEIGWIADYPDPENFLDVLFHSDSVVNHIGYNNSEMDRLLEEARVETDSDARLSLYRDIEYILVNEAVWLPIYYPRTYYLVKPYVKGFSPSSVIIPVLIDVWIER